MLWNTLATVVLAVAVAFVYYRLTRMERVLMALDDLIGQIEGDVQALGADLTRELADLATAMGSSVPADALTRLNAIATSLTGFKAQIDTADPAHTTGGTTTPPTP